MKQASTQKGGGDKRGDEKRRYLVLEVVAVLVLLKETNAPQFDCSYTHGSQRRLKMRIKEEMIHLL